jgi:hypothetical protein
MTIKRVEMSKSVIKEHGGYKNDYGLLPTS